MVTALINQCVWFVISTRNEIVTLSSMMGIKLCSESCFITTAGLNYNSQKFICLLHARPDRKCRISMDWNMNGYFHLFEQEQQV